MGWFCVTQAMRFWATSFSISWQEDAFQPFDLLFHLGFEIFWHGFSLQSNMNSFTPVEVSAGALWQGRRPVGSSPGSQNKLPTAGHFVIPPRPFDLCKTRF